MQPTSTILHYQIIRPFSKGGFGTLFLAQDSRSGAQCVLKQNLELGPEGRRQFEREAGLLQGLNHPGLAKVIELLDIPEGQFLALEYVEGEDLQERLNRLEGRAMPESEILALIGQVCDALAYLHGQNPPVIHRDIKPANIRATPDGRAVLVDFGLAKTYQPHQHTTVGARGISQGYSPPEQYGSGMTDLRSDIYALGATLYALFVGKEPLESVQRMGGGSLFPISRYNPTVSLGVDYAIRKAMALEPANRYPDIQSFIAALFGGAAPAAENTEAPARPPLVSAPIPQAQKEQPMTGAYSNVATSDFPALVIYLVDISGSMNKALGDSGVTRIQTVSDALYMTIQEMVARSSKQGVIRARYELALYAYSDDVYDIYGGVKRIDEVANLGIPELAPQNRTNMTAASQFARDLLYKQLNTWSKADHQNRPAPLIVHMTDAELKDTYGDPLPFVNEIKAIQTGDGAVLVENIFITETLARIPPDPAAFSGFQAGQSLGSPLAERLLAMSSPLPETYRKLINESESLNLQAGAQMMFPGATPKFVRVAFALSGVSGAARAAAKTKNWEEDD